MSHTCAETIITIIKNLAANGYYYDPKDPEGRAGHKTQIRCPDWGAEGREIQVLKRQHNIYFRPMMYRGGLPGSCTSQGAMSRRTGHSSFPVLRSSRGSVGPRLTAN
ncbi:hypothetical protein MTP99_005553 [Tenebrio molitor]|nr:hypothetical protein MTP99_005553 [Tenebrio molitor]